jgi:hypothetical protein
VYGKIAAIQAVAGCQSTLCRIFVNLLDEISSSYEDLTDAISNSKNFENPEFRSALRRWKNLLEPWADSFSPV